MPLKFILPVCDKDVAQMGRVLETIKVLGGAREHPALIVSTPKAEVAAKKLVPLAERVFGEVGFHAITRQDDNGWPSACNTIFKGTVSALLKSGNRDPWYFFEADNLPLREGWQKEIADEYEKGQKPFMGAVVSTLEANLETGEQVQKGRHMNGSAIYPPWFPRGSRLYSSIPPDSPWDLWLQYEIVPQATESKLIQKNWGSVNYRREGEQIICDRRNPKFGDNDPVNPQAAVIHGWKDLTLPRLLYPKIWK